MKVIAENRDIIYSNSCGCSGMDGYLNVDGNSGSGKILAFQKFANKKGFKDSNGKPLVEDGKWGRNTNQAAALYGKEFDLLVASDAITIPRETNGNTDNTGMNTVPKTSSPSNKGIGGALDTITGLLTKGETNPAVSSTKTPEQVKADKKKKMIKVALIAGGAIALTVIIIAIVKRKK